jgi:hypothetical protein
MGRGTREPPRGPPLGRSPPELRRATRGQQGREWLDGALRSLKGVEVRDIGFHRGSCGTSGAIHFHRATILRPPTLVDYVVVHERAYLQGPSHTPELWRRVERTLPDDERRKHWLAEHGGGHIAV